MEPSKRPSNNLQLIWGAALILMGVAVFFKIPQQMPKLAEMGQSDSFIWLTRACLYLIGFILVGGGVKKLMRHFKPEENTSGDAPSEGEDT